MDVRTKILVCSWYEPDYTGIESPDRLHLFPQLLATTGTLYFVTYPATRLSDTPQHLRLYPLLNNLNRIFFLAQGEDPRPKYDVEPERCRRYSDSNRMAQIAVVQ